MSHFQFKNIIYDKKKDHVAEITINRPEQRNALNLETMRELTEAFQNAESDNSIGVVVLTGSGDKVFVAGADIKMFGEIAKNPHESWKLIGQFLRVVYNMKTIGKPVIGKINGSAIGAGVELILACDLLIAAEHAIFIGGEAGVGLVPVGGTTQLLTPTIGDKRARWLLFTDDSIDAKTALEWGLVNKVVPKDKLDEEVDKLCKTILNKSMWALRFAKSQANIWSDLASNSFSQGRDFWTLEATMLPDLLEAASSFLEKKPMDWMRYRELMATGKAAEYLWGPPTKVCTKCDTKNLPENLKYCGNCGAKLA